nr:efflux RND transporter periplasmic adaptor subunit [Deltaproteobacteria bacterium]
VDSSLHKARLKQAKAEQRAAKRELARADKLQGVISSAERDAARDRLDLAFTGTRIAELAASRAAVRAPFDGVLAEVDLERGEVAAPGAPVARLVQLDPIKINLSVADRDVVALKVGTEVQIQTDGNAGHRTGTIVRIGPAADLETRAFTVEVEADNADRALLPGMIARVDIEQAIARDALVIPQSFLVTKREENGVFIIEDEVARWRPLTLGALVRDQVVIEDGLDVGANIVVVGQRGLADGDPLIVSRQGRCCEQGRPVFDRSTP